MQEEIDAVKLPSKTVFRRDGNREILTAACVPVTESGFAPDSASQFTRSLGRRKTVG